MRGHGFDVEWNEKARTLDVSLNTTVSRTVLPKEDINIKKADIPVHQKLYDVYSTDIKTYLNGDEIRACNINGETLVKFADLSSVGYVKYDDNDRLASLDVIKSRLDEEYANADNKEEIILSDGITYTGQVKDGKPNGIGIKYDKSQMTEFPGTINDIITIGMFTDGEIDGMYSTEGTYRYTIGNDLGEYSRTELGNTKINYEVATSNHHVYGDKLYYSISTVKNMPQYHENGVYLRGGRDNEYLYCVSSDNLPNVSEYTVYTNGDVNIEPSELPKFRRFKSGRYFDVMAVSEDSKLYTLPYSEDYKEAAECYSSENVADGVINDNSYSENDWILTEDNKLYAFADNKSVCVAENAVQAGADNYLSADGVLYEDLHDGGGYHIVDTDVKMFDGDKYMIYLKNDGSVWTYRMKATDFEWMDGKDYSRPVKRAEDARYVSCDSFTCMYVKNDGFLWGFGMSEDGELGYDGGETSSGGNEIDYEAVYSREHVKIGDGFVSCKISAAACMALDTDGGLWVWGSNRNALIDSDKGEIITKPVKAAEDVKDYAYSGALYVIKNDVTLWYRGKTYYNSSRYIQDNIDEFTQCTQVYNRAK